MKVSPCQWWFPIDKNDNTIPDEQTIRTLGTGTNLMNGGSFGGF